MKRIFLAVTAVVISLAAIAQDGLSEGSPAPDFRAKDQYGNTIVLSEVLKKGKVVLIFYRGYWCPNCSRALKSYQDSFVQLTEKNLTVIAVSPETAEGVSKTVEKSDASFSVISDSGLAIMNKYQVAFKVTPEMNDIHKKYGIDVVGNNGSNGNILPRPAAFIINESGIITHRYFNAAPYSNPLSNDRITVKEILEIIQ